VKEQMNKQIFLSRKASNMKRRQSSGQTLVEYALILAFISVVAIVVLQALGSKVTSVYSTINAQLSAAQSSS
jgi:Flp pilus assembly pilin Flp